MFCILSPDGREWLTRASRGPEMVFGPFSPTQQMNSISKKYPVKGDPAQAVMQDFHSFRQALNVASADQRVLVLVSGPQENLDKLRQSLRPVASDKTVIGRFHFDFDTNDTWTKNITSEQGGQGIVIIHPGEFGMDGKVFHQLPLDADDADILAAMVKANITFAKNTAKKVYSQHVAKGHQLGVYFEGAVPYGEDRDGDGKIDHGGIGKPLPRRP